MTTMKRITTVLALVAFAAALSLPVATSAEPGPAPAKAPALTTSHPSAVQDRDDQERHPEIRDAMKLLGDAQDHLKHAASDFGGHRVKAMHHIDEAMQELKMALASDKH